MAQGRPLSKAPFQSPAFAAGDALPPTIRLPADVNVASKHCQISRTAVERPNRSGFAPISKPKSGGERYDVDVVRVAAGEYIAGLRDFVDGCRSAEDMNVCQIEPEIGRPPITEPEGEPVSIRIRQTSCTKGVWHRCLVEGNPAAKRPIGIELVSRTDAAEPGGVPLLRLGDQSGAVGPFDVKCFDYAPIRPLRLCQ